MAKNELHVKKPAAATVDRLLSLVICLARGNLSFKSEMDADVIKYRRLSYQESWWSYDKLLGGVEG